LPSATRFIAVSEHVKRVWGEAGLVADRIDVVYNGVDPAHYLPPDGSDTLERRRGRLGLVDVRADDLVVAYCGRLDREKGLEVLIGAVNLLPHMRIHLVIIGGPTWHPTPEAADRYVGELRRGAPSARFLGRHLDVVPLLQAVDVLVLPSVNEEPFGRVLIEAMSCGVPALGSRTGGIPEVLSGEFSRWLFRPGDMGELAQKLSVLNGWRTRWPRLAGACRTHVDSHFTLTRTLDGIEATLGSATSTPGSLRRGASHSRLARWGRGLGPRSRARDR